jgi:hypothetical protein
MMAGVIDDADAVSEVPVASGMTNRHIAVRRTR